MISREIWESVGSIKSDSSCQMDRLSGVINRREPPDQCPANTARLDRDHRAPDVYLRIDRARIPASTHQFYPIRGLSVGQIPAKLDENWK